MSLETFFRVVRRTAGALAVVALAFACLSDAQAQERGRGGFGGFGGFGGGGGFSGGGSGGRF